MSKRKTILEVQAEFPDVLVLKYEGADAVTVRYECGHVVSGVAAGSLRKGNRCRKCSHNAPKGVLEYQAEFGDVIVLKVENSKNMIVKYECGHVRETAAHNLRAGQHCGECSHNAPKGVLQRQAEFDDLLVLKVENAFAVTVRGECGHVWTAHASSLRAGNRCAQCSPTAPKGVLEYQAEFQDVLVLKVESALAVTVKSPICGHVWTARTNNLRNGSRCRRCCSRGYNPGKPGWLYFMERPGEMQIGITNDPDRRLATHAREGWELVEMDGPRCGTTILRREKAIKKHLRENDLLIEGTHENWLSSMWSPHSITAIEKVRVR